MSPKKRLLTDSLCIIAHWPEGAACPTPFPNGFSILYANMICPFFLGLFYLTKARPLRVPRLNKYIIEQVLTILMFFDLICTVV